MFTVPNPGGPFVVDGFVWVAFTVLLGVGSTQATSSGGMNTNGTVDLNGPIDDSYNWYRPTTTGIGSNYWVRATLLSGDLPSGSALNTWLALSSARAWQLTTTGSATIRSKECVLKLEFSVDSGGAVIVGTNTLHIEALVDNS